MDLFVFRAAPLLCGKRETTRIVGGQGTRIENWPWQAMLETADSDSEQFCGGSLLNNEWVVTAAHCVHGEQASDMRIRFVWFFLFCFPSANHCVKEFTCIGLKYTT